MKFLYSLFTALILLSSSASAATLTLSGSAVLGATDVEVLGHRYDVSFDPRSCNDLFSNCNVFAFDTSEAAQAASQALLDLIGTERDRPFDFRGCSHAATCYLATPFGLNSQGKVRFSSLIVTGHSVSNVPNYIWNTNNFGSPTQATNSIVTFAVWKKIDVAAVPVPATAFLLAGALGGLGLMRRRKRY